MEPFETAMFVLELVVYRVKDAAAFGALRAEAETRLRAFPGFVSWSHLQSVEGASERVDLVCWRSLDQAVIAAEAVRRDPAFAAFRSAVAELRFMRHFRPGTALPFGARPAEGAEIGFFRLKPGVSEATMRDAWRAMVETRLSREPGWRRENLLRLDDGRYLDLAGAESRARSEAICAGWKDWPECEPFLALIEDASLAFAEVLD